MKNVGNPPQVRGLVSEPLVRPEVVAQVKGVATTPLGTGSATNEHRTILGAVPAQRSADPLVAKGLVESVAFALSGSTRDIEAYVKGPSLERLEKVNRGLAHLLKEAEAARESPDVQLIRMKGDLKPSLDRVENGFTNLLAAFGKLDDVTLKTAPTGLGSLVQKLLGGAAGQTGGGVTPKEIQRDNTLRQEGLKLLEQLGDVLTHGVTLEVPKDWNIVNLQGETIERSSPATPAQIYPTLADGQNRRVPENAIRAHLKGETLLAQGDARGAVMAFQDAATAILIQNHSIHGHPPELGIAMLYLADAVTAAGLEKTPLKFGRDNPANLDVAGLYSAAMAILRESNSPSSPLMEHAVPRVYAGLRELGELDAASKLIHSVTQGTEQYFSPKHLLFPGRGNS